MTTAQDWRLTRPALDCLLELLDRDADAAAKKYEHTRNTLIRFFAGRGCHTPEDQADRTIDRVARRVADGVAIDLDEPLMYFYGVARHVLQEYHRRPSAQAGRPGKHRMPSRGPDDAETRHRRFDCMDRCLDELPAPSRTLLVDYYAAEKNGRDDARRDLAARMGVSINTLRLRVHRLREQLARNLRKLL